MSDAPPPTPPEPVDPDTNSETNSNTDASPSPPTPEDEARTRGVVQRLWNRLKWPLVGGALAGMILGAVVEMFVQGLLESTGWFGPTIDNLIQEQMANFDAVQAKLAELQAATTDEERKKLESELKILLEEQRKIAGRTHTELQQSQQEIQDLRVKVLEEKGHEGAVDFYLRPGESVNLGAHGNAFAVNSVHAGFIVATINGKRMQLKPGEFADAEMEDGTYRVVYRMAPTKTDRTRAGFDLIRPAAK